jgi:2-dehydropantoate 2-reductase
MAELWTKLMVNCAYNAISALAQMPYGRLAAQPAIRELQQAVVREVVAVAQAEGQPLPLDAALAAMERIATAMPLQLSSTAQDLARGKPTEIDHLNGTVARRGAELGIATPVNQALHALVKLVESGRAAG